MENAAYQVAFKVVKTTAGITKSVVFTTLAAAKAFADGHKSARIFQVTIDGNTGRIVAESWNGMVNI